MFDQTLAHSQTMFDERCSPMYEICNINRPSIVRWSVKTVRCPAGSRCHTSQKLFPLESLAVRSSPHGDRCFTRTILPMRTDVWALLTPPPPAGKWDWGLSYLWTKKCHKICLGNLSNLRAVFKHILTGEISKELSMLEQPLAYLYIISLSVILLALWNRRIRRDREYIKGHWYSYMYVHTLIATIKDIEGINHYQFVFLSNLNCQSVKLYTSIYKSRIDRLYHTLGMLISWYGILLI
jgi:hypothetical protein